MIGEVTVGVDVPTVATLPLVVVYAAPAPSVGKKRLELMVVDEFENRPFRKPIAVVVEL